MKEVPLTRGQVALVDDEDFERISCHKWYASWCDFTQSYYANREASLGKGRSRNIHMHREVVGLEYGDKREVDHRNHETLDNQKYNLRVCEHAQNGRNQRKKKNNTSGFKGVSFSTLRGRWRSYINLNRKQVHLGYFDSKEEAAEAYKKASIAYHGEFASPE